MYREVQLNFTPEIEVLYFMLDSPLPIVTTYDISKSAYGKLQVPTLIPVGPPCNTEFLRKKREKMMSLWTGIVRPVSVGPGAAGQPAAADQRPREQEAPQREQQQRQEQRQRLRR